MKSLVSGFCASLVVFAGTFVCAAQDKSTASKESKEVRQETKTYHGNGSSAKVSTDRVNGKIESYEPGKSIKVTVPGKIVSTKSWDLDNKDWTYHVPSNLKTGQWVNVSERTADNGHKTLTVSRSASKGTASRSAR